MKKQLITPFLAFFFFSLGNAQNCVWAKSGDGYGYNWGDAICNDAFGNTYVSGTFQAPTISFGNYTLTNSGVGNIFVTKYDVFGNVVWVKSGNGNGNDWGASVNTDKQGNLFVTGLFTSSVLTIGTETLLNKGATDYYLAKYDTDGNVLWAKSIGAEGDETTYSVKTDSQGNVFVAGYTTSNTLTIGTNTFSSPNNCIFLVKYDTNGNVIWSKGASGEARCYNVTVDIFDNVIVTGEFINNFITMDNLTLNYKFGGVSNYFLIKLDSNGNVIWGVNENPRLGYSLGTNTLGDIFLVGYYNTPTISIGSYTFANSQNGYYECFLVKYDLNGNVKWANSFGSTNDDFVYSIATDLSNIYITGKHTNPITFGSTTLAASTYDPMFLVKCDFGGNIVSAISLKSGGGGFNNQNGVCADNLGNVYIVSDFQCNPFSINEQTLVLTGQRNPFIAKFNFNDVGIKEVDLKNQKTKVLPNPNAGNFELIMKDEEDKVEVFIYDISGRQVYQENRSIKNHGINLTTDLPNGVYLVKVKLTDGSTDVHRIVIDK